MICLRFSPLFKEYSIILFICYYLFVFSRAGGQQARIQTLSLQIRVGNLLTVSFTKRSHASSATSQHSFSLVLWDFLLVLFTVHEELQWRTGKTPRRSLNAFEEKSGFCREELPRNSSQPACNRAENQPRIQPCALRYVTTYTSHHLINNNSLHFISDFNPPISKCFIKVSSILPFTERCCRCLVLTGVLRGAPWASAGLPAMEHYMLIKNS